MLTTKDSRGFTAVFFLGGIVSGILSVLAAEVSGQGGNVVPSVSFGLILSLCLIVLGMISSIRQIFFVIGASIAAYAFALLAAGFTELALPSSWSIGDKHSPIALFVGGFIGALVITSGTFGQAQSRTRLRDSTLNIALCSVVGGVLGVIGWALGPSLGMALWHADHALRLTAPTETPLNAAGETSHALSMCLLWQAGMGLVLGVALQRLGVNRAREVQQS